MFLWFLSFSLPFTKHGNGNKYLIFDSIDKNKEILTKYTELRDKIKYLIKTINGGNAGKYETDLMKVKFNSDDHLSLNKTLKLHILTVIYIIHKFF